MQIRTSPLRVEINPWTLDVALEEVMRLRGAYVAAMGTIETILTELAIRASKAEEYDLVRAKFPSRRPDRLKYLQAVCDMDGPLTPYRSIIISVVARFEAGLSLRDMLAHGRMKITSFSSELVTIDMQDYSAAGEFIKLRRDNFKLTWLRSRTYRMTRLSRCVDLLYSRLGDRLPAVAGAFAGSEPLA